MRAPLFALVAGVLSATTLAGGDAAGYACAEGFVPGVSVEIVGGSQIVGRGRQVLIEARTGDCKETYPIEASRLAAAVAPEPDGTFIPLVARAEGNRLVWRADRAGDRFIRVTLPGSRTRPGQIVLLVTDASSEVTRPRTARIHLRPAPTDATDLLLEYLPAGLSATARSAWSVPTIPIHWPRSKNEAKATLPRGAYALRTSPFSRPVGELEIEGEGEYWIDLR